MGRSLKKHSVSGSQFTAKSPTTSTIGSNLTATSQLVNNLISTGSKQINEFFKCIQFVLQQNTN